MRRADSWGHSASLSPEEERGGKLTWGTRQAECQGAWQSQESRLLGHLHELPPWGSSPWSWAERSIPPPGRDLPHEEAMGRGLPRLQSPGNPRGSGLPKPLRAGHQKCWVFGTLLH